MYIVSRRKFETGRIRGEPDEIFYSPVFLQYEFGHSNFLVDEKKRLRDAHHSVIFSGHVLFKKIII